MRERTKILISLAVVLFISIGCSSAVKANTLAQDDILVFLDMDAAPDDFGALCYLLRHPSVTVIGIGVSCGVSYVDQGVNNALRVLEYLGISDIPVAAGKNTPLFVDHTFPTAWREASNNSFGLDLPTTSQTPSPMNASELMISLITAAPENVTIVSLGPLTNVAAALEAQPSIKTKIDKIHIMGGAVGVPGNVGPESGGAIINDVSEWNMWVDPHAADIVFQSGLPITLVPLDATNQVPVTNDFKNELESVMATPEAELVYNATAVGLYFWDQFTAVSLTNPEVVTFEEHTIEIIVDLPEHEGQTNSTGTGSVLVAVDADADTFEDLFIGYINGDLPTTPITPTGTTPTATTTTTPTTGVAFPMDSIILYAAIVGVVILVLVSVVCMRRR